MISYFKKKSPQSLARIIASTLIIAIASLVWDAWWHITIGRDTFLEPPHLFLYASVTIAIVPGISQYYISRNKLWRNLAIVLVLIPASAPFDELWHRMFGVENLTTPLIVWSPPHLMLFGSLIASAVMLLPLLRKDNLATERLFGALLFAAALSLLMLIAGPFYPLGPYKLLSFWGAGILSFTLVSGYLIARDWLPNLGSTTLVALFAVVFYFIYDAIPSPLILIPPYPKIPAFIVAFCHVLPAIILDAMKGRGMGKTTEGVITGALYGIILYGTAPHFIDAHFRYPMYAMSIAIASCAAGGLLAGILISQGRKGIKQVLG